MKTITVASQPPRDLATADPCNQFLWVPSALSRAHCPPATLASLFSLPQASRAPVSGLCICIPFDWSLAGTHLPRILSAGFLPSLIQKSLVLSNIPSKHTASRHSPSSHLTFFPSWHLLPDTVTYLFVDLFECPSPPQYTGSSSVSATTACPQPRQCSPYRRHKEVTLL